MAIKGFFRRANLIPNAWKKKIGAMHELYTLKPDNNVQIQGLPGRMTGYWKELIISGFKTGPYRTSVKSIKEYEQSYDDIFGVENYTTSGFKVKNGTMKLFEEIMLSPSNIKGLKTDIKLPIEKEEAPKNLYKICETLKEVKDYLKSIGKEKSYRTPKMNDDGFYHRSTTKKRKILELQEAIEYAQKHAKRSTTGEETIFLPCYKDTNNKDSLVFVVPLYNHDSFGFK
jgi:hypothetical protein